MNPHLRDVNDFKHKLWDHLAIMSNFSLDIDSPYPTPTKETFQAKPNRISYNTNEIEFRHFGRTIELLIERAVLMPESEEKEVLIKLIANHMKKSYLMWNKEIVSDTTIFGALKSLSHEKIDIDMQLRDSREILARNKRKRSSRKDNSDKRKQ